MELQSGILHAEEKDYKTSYSYFFEAFETYNTLNSKALALRALQYMLLAKIMMGSPQDVPSLLSGKVALQYKHADVDSLMKIAKACVARALHDFEAVQAQFAPSLATDRFIVTHLRSLYGRLLEQNLSRLIEPYSRVELAHVAKLIDLPVAAVEKQLSQMVLEGTIDGIIDQGQGYFIVFDEKPVDRSFPAARNTIAE